MNMNEKFIHKVRPDSGAIVEQFTCEKVRLRLYTIQYTIIHTLFLYTVLGRPAEK